MKNNKARITYRFEHSDPRIGSNGRSAQESNPVIPLTAEEFTVVDERSDDTIVYRRFEEEESELSDHSGFVSTNTSAGRQPLNQFTTDFGSWSSPFDEETERVERMIRETNRAAVTPEAPLPNLRNPSDPMLVNGETGYYREPSSRISYPENEYGGAGRVSVTSTGTRFNRHTRTPWIKIVASVTGAITTGVLIGFFVLSLFSGDDTKNGAVPATGNAIKDVSGAIGTNDGTNTTTPLASANTNTKASPNSSTPANASANGTSATLSVKIPAKTYTLLQYGAFANQQGADAAQAELRKLGLASANQTSDKVYVYAGMTPNRDDALALSNKLKAQKAEVYIKTLSSPAVTSIKWNGKQTDAVDTYFTQAGKLTAALTSVTTQHLKETTPGLIEDSAIQSIHTAHQAWSGSATAVGDGLKEEQKTILQKMNKALNTAVQSLDEYKKNTSASFLWQAQSGTMQYMLLENELLLSLSAN